jgi:hypothetical protein
MNITIGVVFVLYLLAFMCFIAAGAQMASKWNLIGVGLALTTLAALLGAIPKGAVP